MEDKKKRPVGPRVEVFYDQKEINKRTDRMLVFMLEGLSEMLKRWGDLECKGGGGVGVGADLYHCHACTWNGIRRHVDGAIEWWKEKQ